MQESTSTDGGAPETGRASAETHQRFQRLRALIHIEFYLRYFAPRTPIQQGGLVGTRDQALESPK